MTLLLQRYGRDGFTRGDDGAQHDGPERGHGLPLLLLLLPKTSLRLILKQRWAADHKNVLLNSLFPGGLNLNLMKTESLWHQHVGYSSGYGQSPHYGLPASPLPTGAVLWAANWNSFWDQDFGNLGNLWSESPWSSIWDHEVMPIVPCGAHCSLSTGQWMICHSGGIANSAMTLYSEILCSNQQVNLKVKDVEQQN